MMNAKLNKLLYVAGFAYVVAIQYGYTKGYQKGIDDYDMVLEQCSKRVGRRPVRPTGDIGRRQV